MTSPVIFIEKYAHKRALTPEYGWFSSRYQVTGYIPESSRRQVRYSTSLSIRTFSVIFFFSFLEIGHWGLHLGDGRTLHIHLFCIIYFVLLNRRYCFTCARAHTHTRGLYFVLFSSLFSSFEPLFSGLFIEDSEPEMEESRADEEKVPAAPVLKAKGKVPHIFVELDFSLLPQHTFRLYSRIANSFVSVILYFYLCRVDSFFFVGYNSPFISES